MIYLRQSTASQEVPLGHFVDDTDGKTAETGLTIANTDIKVWKTGATTLASKNSGGGTHISGGVYYCVLDATDTDTIGPLVLFVAVSGALAVRVECCVLDEAMYDHLFGTNPPLTPTTAGRTLDVSAGGEAGVDWANVGSPATAVNLSGTTVKTATDVEADTADIQGRLPAALTAGGNIKADALALSGDTAAADNAESFFDGTGYAGTNNVIPTVTTVTTATNVTTVNGLANNVITAASINADAITAAKIADGAIDAATFAAGAITAAAIAADAIGASELAADAVAEIAAGVWDLDTTGHTTGGTFGAAMNAAGSAGDPWSTSLPGAYASGTAGFILGTNLDAAVTSRLASASYTAPLDAAGVRSAVGLASANLDTQLTTLDDFLDTEIAAIKAKTDNLPSVAVLCDADGRLIVDAYKLQWALAEDGTLTVYRADNSTVAYTRGTTNDPDAAPITGTH